MKAILCCLFLIAWALPIALPAASESPATVYDVPAWSEPVPRSSVIPEEAFQVEVMNVSGAPTDTPQDRLGLAWSDEGLIVWADVQDASHHKSSSPKELWRGDSLDIFLTLRGAQTGMVQLIIAPGRLASDPEPSWHYGVVKLPDHDRPLPEPDIHVTSDDEGYFMSVLIPWEVIPGDFREKQFGFQAYIKHVGQEGDYRSHWYPALDTWRDPSKSFSIRLANRAGAPVTMQATFSVKQLRNIELTVRATPDLAGNDVLVRCVEDPEGNLGNSWRKVGVIAMDQGQDLAHITLPPELAKAAGSLWEVKVGAAAIPIPLVMPDLKEARLNVLQSVQLNTEHTIFSGNALPAFSLKQPELVSAGLGDVTISSRYFDRDYQKVEQANTPGRYGALVTMSTSDGLTNQREITLYRTEESFSRKTDFYDVEMRFPEPFGIPNSVLQAEQTNVKAFLNSQLYDLPYYTSSWAVLAAGLHDMAQDPEAFHGFGVWDIHNIWWYGLQKKLDEAQPYERLVYLPEGYHEEPGRDWPLMLFLHGSGERGSDLNKVKVHGPPKVIEAGEKLPFIVVAPQCPGDEWWNPDKLQDLMTSIRQEYRVDSNRMYVTGLSMGGHGTWALIGRYPNQFAAAAPICGGANPELAERVTTVPVWAFHGGADSVVPLFRGERITQALEEAGGDVQLTVYPGVGHNSWTRTYNNDQLYKWFLEHEK